MSKTQEKYQQLTQDLQQFYQLDGTDAAFVIASYPSLSGLYQDYPLLKPTAVT